MARCHGGCNVSKATYQKASNQLGMHEATARGRLSRLILFSFAQRLELDTCFRCGEKIERVEDLSIEHKVPWLDVDPALFWDLNNIAFSHLSCNSGAARQSPIKLKNLDNNSQTYHDKMLPGMAWCSGHQKSHSISEFSPDADRPMGTQSSCRTYWKEWYKEHHAPVSVTL